MVDSKITSQEKGLFKAGVKCVELAVETQGAFDDVMGLTAELTAAVSGSQGEQDIKIREAIAELNATRTQSELMDEQKDFMLQRYEEQKKVTAPPLIPSSSPSNEA